MHMYIYTCCIQLLLIIMLVVCLRLLRHNDIFVQMTNLDEDLMNILNQDLMKNKDKSTL